jgi:RNA polymerase sigma-70 factor (ECF subfamily)
MHGDEPARIASDEAALERFYRAHVDLVERFIARRVADPHLAADLTSEVFLAAIDAAPLYDRRRGTPSAWLVGIARNVVLSEFRRAARERRARGRIDARELLDADDVVRLQERIDAEARSRELFDALASLPAGEREVLELVAVDDLNPREAAAVLGISYVAARVRLHRARAAMHKALDPEAPAVNQPVEA